MTNDKLCNSISITNREFWRWGFMKSKESVEFSKGMQERWDAIQKKIFIDLVFDKLEKEELLELLKEDFDISIVTDRDKEYKDCGNWEEIYGKCGEF